MTEQLTKLELKEKEQREHVEIQHKIAKLCEFLKVSSFCVASNDRITLFDGNSVKIIKGYNEDIISGMNGDLITANRIDVIIDLHKSLLLVEIEHSTKFKNGINRMYDFIRTNSKININALMIIPDYRKKELLKELRHQNYHIINEEDGNCILDYISFITYSDFNAMCNCCNEISKDFITKNSFFTKLIETKYEKFKESKHTEKNSSSQPEKVVDSVINIKDFEYVAKETTEKILKQGVGGCNIYNIQNSDIYVPTKVDEKNTEIGIRKMLKWFGIPNNEFAFVRDPNRKKLFIHDQNEGIMGFNFRGKFYKDSKWRGSFRKFLDLISQEKNFEEIIFRNGGTLDIEGKYFEGCFFKKDEKTGLLIRKKPTSKSLFD